MDTFRVGFTYLTSIRKIFLAKKKKKKPAKFSSAAVCSATAGEYEQDWTQKKIYLEKKNINGELPCVQSGPHTIHI